MPEALHVVSDNLQRPASMKSRQLLAHVLAIALIPAPAASAAQSTFAYDIAVERFVTLPDDVRYPEGLAVDEATGEIYVGTFDARMPESTRDNRLLRYSKEGRLLASRPFGHTPLTGLAFRDGHIYVLNFGLSKLQRLEARFGPSTRIEDVAAFKALTPPSPTPRTVTNPDGSQDRIVFGASGMPGINGIVFDRQGSAWVSDSFQGAIYKIVGATRCSRCEVKVVSRDPLLGTSGSLPFGANGLAFDSDETHLYVTNAGDSRLLRMEVARSSMEVVAESLHGADGLVQHQGLFWVAANQADQVVAVDSTGRQRARVGRFEGIDQSGSPRALLFPATIAVNGEWMIVTNLSLPTSAALGDEWEEATTSWTLSRFRIPR